MFSLRLGGIEERGDPPLTVSKVCGVGCLKALAD
jgi:hypothetical protein